MILGSCFLEFDFNIVTLILWKSEDTLSFVQEDSKLRGWVLRMRLIHVGLLLFYKQVGFFRSDFKL